MFEDSLLESAGRFKGRQRKVTTLVSFVVQAFFLGVLVFMSLWYTQVLPTTQVMTLLVAPPPPPPPPPPPAAPPKVAKPVQTNVVSGELRTPTKIPEKVQMIKEEAPPPAVSTGGVVGGVPGGIPGGQLGGVMGGIITSVPAPVPLASPKPAAPQRVRLSQGVSEGMLLHKVSPTYPLLAREAHIQGSVVLQAVISKQGSIENLKVVQGYPLLASAAMAAVKQWKFKPYVLNGEPVEVETVFTVNFSFAGS